MAGRLWTADDSRTWLAGRFKPLFTNTAPQIATEPNQQSAGNSPRHGSSKNCDWSCVRHSHFAYMYMYLRVHVHELKLVCVKLHSLGFTSSHIAVTASFDVVTKSSSTSDYVVTNNSACTSRVMSSQTVAQHNHCAFSSNLHVWQSHFQTICTLYCHE